MWWGEGEGWGRRGCCTPGMRPTETRRPRLTLLHFNLPLSLYSIRSSPTGAPGVGGKDLRFELRKTVFEHAGTSHPGFLPSPLLPLTPPPPPFPFPSFPFASPSFQSRLRRCIPALAAIPLGGRGGRRSYAGRQRRRRRRCIYGTEAIVARCCRLGAVIVLQEWSQRSSLFCLKSHNLNSGATFNTF